VVNSFSKILEKLILYRTSWSASISHWLSPNQHGFSQEKSTKTASHSFVSFCEATKANNCVTVCAFLDIKSTFDAAWHQEIISALDSWKYPRYMTRLILGFLSDSTANLSLGSTVSSVRVDLGCPQGGVLSPILWSVLIEDVLRLKFPFPSLSVGFADDLTMATHHKDPLIATKICRLCAVVSATGA
jgi:hypothetical protein